MTGSDDVDGGRPSSKVARLIDEYGLEGLGEEVERRWTDTGSARMSLRSLADHFNQRLLESALGDAGVTTSDTDLETMYHHLTGDGVSTGVRTDTRNRLARNGVDVEKLTQDFVTYQAIRSYLTDYRGAEYEGNTDEQKIEKDLESIQRLVARTHSVTEDRIETLRDTGRFDIGEFDVLLDVSVFCHGCGRQYSVSELFEERGCGCT
jgi:hypothetical protein